jgi:nucleoside-diphosphate-sugar epimerase
MKVLILGGTGWVGHNIALAFYRAGHEVTIFSRGKSTDFTNKVAFLPHVTGDKNDEATLKNVLKSQQFDVVIDSVPHENTIDILSRMHNLYGRYIHCSSTGVYTPLKYFPADEKHPFGQKIYKGFEDKVKSDAAALEFAAAGKLKLTIIRPCCIAGPGKLPLDNLGGRRVSFIPDILANNALDLLNDGLTLIQVVHVRDLGRAFVQAAERPETIGQVYNICSAKAVTLKRYCEINAAALGKQAKFNYFSFEAMISKYGKDICDGLTFLSKHMCFDITKASQELNYYSEYTTEAAIGETARLNAASVDGV